MIIDRQVDLAIGIVDWTIDQVISWSINKSSRSSDWSIDRLKVVDRATTNVDWLPQVLNSI
jgi:hypothetical protein